MVPIVKTSVIVRMEPHVTPPQGHVCVPWGTSAPLVLRPVHGDTRARAADMSVSVGTRPPVTLRTASVYVHPVTMATGASSVSHNLAIV